MKIVTTSRIAKVFAIALLFSASISLAQHPKGKWYSCQPLPGLSKTGHLLFVDSLLGYYIGIDTGFVTRDGGQSWHWINFPSDARPEPSYLFAPDHNTIISYQPSKLDSDGIPYPGIIKSTNQGSTWSLVSSKNFPSAVKAFTMWNANDGFRIWLDNITYKDTASVTHDGGITWTDVRGDITLEKYIKKLQGSGAYEIHDAWSDPSHGAISVSVSSAGSSTTAYPVLITSDGGKTWAETFPKLNGDATIPHTYAYAYPGSQSFWVLPSKLTGIEEYFYYSSDFGTSWINTKPFAKYELGASTKGAVLTLAPVSPTETWALIAADTDHPDLTKFMAYYDQSTGWSRGDTIIFGATGGPFGWHLNNFAVQFVDKQHGWQTATQSYFDLALNSQIIKDSVFLFNFRTSPPVKEQGGVEQISKTNLLRCTPNPASSYIRFDGFVSDEIVKDIKVVDALGNSYFATTKNIGSGIEMNTGNLPSGSYVIVIITSARTESHTIMVVH